MQSLNRMKSICGYIFRGILFLSCLQQLNGQDTLRTYGPRIGIDLSRFAYLFTTPSQVGAELSLDAEVFNNIYPVIEMGYTRLSETTDLFDYSSKGSYARAGIDYNLLAVEDRSVHHTITLGLRYGLCLFSHRASNVLIPSNYWGDFILDSYDNSLTGNWFELVGGIKSEVVPNLFLGWSVRYKILLNPQMDPLVTPHLVPGYGNGTTDRGFGFSYSILYTIPLLKK